jgi:hypothetical protein
MAFVHSPKIVTDGLVLALDAGNVKSYPGSGITWLDKSGRGNNGTLTNGPTFNSGSLGSIVFDGTDDGVNLPNINTSDGKTYLIWVKNTSTSGLRLAYAHRDPDRVYLGVNNTDVYLRVGSDSSYISGVTLTVNLWFLLGIRINSITEYEGFVNGISLGTRTTTLDSSTGTGLGAYYNNTDQPFGSYWQGSIASTQIYNRALSAQEVLQNYNATKGRFGL